MDEYSTQFNTSRIEKKNDIDILRLSQTVKNNMQRENQEYGFRTKNANNKDDVDIENHDIELNFNEKFEDEEENKAEKHENNKIEENFNEKDNIDDIFENMKEESSKNKIIHFGTENSLGTEKPLRKITGESSKRIVQQESKTTLKHDKSNANDENFSASQSNNLQEESTTEIYSFENLVIDPKDSTVTPIIGNKNIERTNDLSISKGHLPFDSISAEDFINLVENNKSDKFVTTLLNATVNSSNSNEQLSILNYFETLIQNNTAANKIINTQFVYHLLKTMQNTKSVNIKIKISSILGHLIRHATIIEAGLAESNLCDALLEQLKDKNEKLRRKAIAAAGEYLFYAATQLEEDIDNSAWDIKSSCVNTLFKCIKCDNDECVRFYACKTIENITAQSNTGGAKFVNIDIMNLFISIYSSTKNDHFRTCVIAALGNFAKINPKIAIKIIEGIGFKIIISNIIDSPSRNLQALLTIILFACKKSYAEFEKYAINDENFLPVIMQIVDKSNVVIKNKIILLISTLLIQNHYWLLLYKSNKILNFIHKILKSNEKDVQKYLKYMYENFNEKFSVVIQEIHEAFKKKMVGENEIVTDNSLYHKISQLNKSSELQGILIMLKVVPEVLSNITISQSVCCSMISVISFILHHQIKEKSSEKIEREEAIFSIIETLCGIQKILFDCSETIITELLPQLIDRLTKNDDTKSFSLELFSSIIIQFLKDDRIYNTNLNSGTTSLINKLITTHVIPQIPEMLKESNKLHVFSLRLLSTILEVNNLFSQELKKQNMIPILFKVLDVHDPIFNKNIIYILKVIVESKVLTIEEFKEYNLIQKVI